MEGVPARGGNEVGFKVLPNQPPAWWDLPGGECSVWEGSGEFLQPCSLGCGGLGRDDQLWHPASSHPLLSCRLLLISPGKVGTRPWSSTRARQSCRSGHRHCWTWSGSPQEPPVPARPHWLPSPRPHPFPAVSGGINCLFNLWQLPKGCSGL